MPLPCRRRLFGVICDRVASPNYLATRGVISSWPPAVGTPFRFLSLSGGTRVCSDRCENARVTLYAPSSSITNNGYHILVGNTYIIITATKVRGGRYAPRVYTPTKLPHHRHTHVMPRKMKSLTPRQTIRFFIHR